VLNNVDCDCVSVVLTQLLNIAYVRVLCLEGTLLEARGRCHVETYMLLDCLDGYLRTCFCESSLMYNTEISWEKLYVYLLVKNIHLSQVIIYTYRQKMIIQFEFIPRFKPMTRLSKTSKWAFIWLIYGIFTLLMYQVTDQVCDNSLYLLNHREKGPWLRDPSDKTAPKTVRFAKITKPIKRFRILNTWSE